MYVPHLFREDDLDTLVGFMTAHSFITLVSVVEGRPFASHIPVVVGRAGDGVTITGHLAKGNPQARWLEAGEALAIFSGPHAYVSPALYEKAESVPTWNYIAVHAYGVPEVVAAGEYGPEGLGDVRGMLEELIETYDPGYRGQWEGLSERYREGMMQGIVGFRMGVTRLEGKYKLSQNGSVADRVNVAEALAGSGDDAIRATGAAMRERLTD